MTEMISWLRQQLDTDEQLALASKQPHVFWYTDGHSDEASAFLDAFNADYVLRQVQAHRAILDEYVAAFELRKRHPGDVGSAGALLALHGAVKRLVSIYSDRDGYAEATGGER